MTFTFVLIIPTYQSYNMSVSRVVYITQWITPDTGKGRKCKKIFPILQMRKTETLRKLMLHPKLSHNKNPDHQTPYFDALEHQTQSRWFCFHDETKVILTSKAVIYFVWALLLNLSGLRTFWLGSWQNEAHFEQPHRQGFLCKQRQERECFSQSVVLTAVLLITYYSFFYLF